MDKEYNKISSVPVIEADSIIYIVNNETASTIVEHPGRYSFWQIYCVTEGEVHILRDGEDLCIREGNMFLLSPKGDLRTAKRAAESDGRFFVISFESSSDALWEMCEREIPLSKSEIVPIEEICSTGAKVLQPIKHNEEKQGLREKSDVHPGVFQYLRVLLEQFLIKIYLREQKIGSLNDAKPKANRQNYEKGIVRQANEFMQKNISAKLSIDEIAEALAVNKTTLRITYKKETGVSIIKAFSRMKVTEAQRLIGETDMNFTQIGEELGFLSLYHFSRFFKEHTGITLSEYSKEIAKK